MKESKPPVFKGYKIESKGDGPSEIVEDDTQQPNDLTEFEKQIGKQIGSTILAYLDGIKELLNGRYAHLRELSPIYLADPGNVLVAYCEDGVVIRYEKRVDERKILIGKVPGKIVDIAPMLSQNVIHCHADQDYTSTIPTSGVLVKFSKQDSSSEISEEIASARIGFDAVIVRPEKPSPPPLKPFCLLSIRNSFEIQMFGELVPTDGKLGQGQEVLIRSPIRLPVGWECIEIFPFFEIEQWKPEYAVLWAENDLLAAVVAQQYQNQSLKSLDSRAETRNHYAELLNNFKKLLDSNPDREEILQVFLQDNPQLLCPTHVSVWPKLGIGARKTDFVFQEASGDYLLVELERSTLRLFVRDGNQSSDLTHARGQILDWKRYLEDNLSTVQRELGLAGISTNPNSLIVIGRTDSLSVSDRRQLTTMNNDSPKLKIMTYDDVYDNAKAVVENLLGPIWQVNGNTQIYYLNNQ